MEKILDYLNGRDFEINTRTGSEEVLTHFLRDNTDRLKHSKRVTDNLTIYLTSLGISIEENNNLIIASNLHDIGYSEQLRLSGYHPFDGYIYLKENGWNTEVCNLVLLHSYSRELAQSKSPELYYTFMLAERDVDLTQLALLTFSDFTASPLGDRITLDERVQDIESRFGINSPVTKHAKLVRYLLHENSTTLRLIMKR